MTPSEGRSAFRALIGLPDARRYVASHAFSLLGDAATALAMGIWVKRLTGSSSAASLVFLAFAVPQLAAPLGGVIVDRLPPRQLLIAVNLAAAAALLPLLAVRDAGDVWIVYTVVAACGAAYSLLRTGQSALLVALVPGELLGHANALLQTIREGLRLIGPLTGTALFAALGGSGIALFAAACLAVAASLLLGVRAGDRRPAARERRAWRAELAEGVRHVRGTPRLARLAGATVLAFAAFGLFEAALFAVVDEGLGRPPELIGVLLAVQGAAAAAGGLAAPAAMARIGEARAAGAGMAAVACGALLLLPGPLAAALAGMALFGVGLAAIVVGTVTLTQRSTPPGLQGRAAAVLQLAGAAPQVAAIAIGATLLGPLGFEAILVGAAALQLAAAAWVVSGERSGRAAAC